MIIYPYGHPLSSAFLSPFFISVAWVMEPIPAVTGQELGHTLARSSRLDCEPLKVYDVQQLHKIAGEEISGDAKWNN